MASFTLCTRREASTPQSESWLPSFNRNVAEVPYGPGNTVNSCSSSGSEIAWTRLKCTGLSKVILM